MARKLPDLKHVKYVKGGRYAYFNTGKKKPNGQPLLSRLPDPADAGFYGSYAAHIAARSKAAPVTRYTVYQMAVDYEASKTFGDLAENTRKLYRVQLRKIRDLLGDFPVDSLEPKYVREMLEKAPWKAGTRSMVTAILGALYKWGRTNDKATINPIKDIERDDGGEHDPWPDDILQAGLIAENELIRLAVHLLYFTGLRIGDALKLRWGQIKDSVITVTPQKTQRTKKALYIPLAAELGVLLDETPRVALTVLPPITSNQLRDKMQAFTRKLGVETVPHGLRKNAVNSLLLAGCSVAEVSSITGQTYKVVEYYAAQINRRKLAGAAIVKLDGARKNNA